MTFGHIGLLGWLWQTGRAERLIGLFAPAGRLALTNYIGQTIVCQWLLFPGFAFGLHDQLGIAALWATALAIIAVQIALSHLWLTWFAIGPLEWVWRWGTYGRRPALRRTSTVT
jgi:uncharacterized protein